VREELQNALERRVGPLEAQQDLKAVGYSYEKLATVIEYGTYMFSDEELNLLRHADDFPPKEPCKKPK
jgi:hypothetical protein